MNIAMSKQVCVCGSPECLICVVSTLEKQKKRLFVVANVASVWDSVDSKDTASALHLAGLGEVFLDSV